MGAQIANRERFPSAAPDGAAPCSGGVSRFTATAWTPAPAQEPRPRRGCPGSRALPSPGPRAPRDGAGRLRFCVPPAAPVWGFPQELQQVLGTANGGRQSPATPHGTGTTLCPSLRGYRTLPTHTLNSGSQDRTEARPGSQRVCPGQVPPALARFTRHPLAPAACLSGLLFRDTPAPHLVAGSGVSC